MAGEGEIVHRFETGESGAAPLPKEFVFGENLLFSTGTSPQGDLSLRSIGYVWRIDHDEIHRRPIHARDE